MGNRRNEYLDVIRAISCILVIFIHRPFPGVAGNIVSAIARSGVALFFIISGYYAYNNNSKLANRNILSRLKHILKILVYALLFYLIWESFIRWFGSGFSSTYNWITNHVLNPHTWYLALVWDRDPVAGHLWFLFALARCYILLFIILKLKAARYTLALSITCLAATVIMQLNNFQTFYFRNGWAFGAGFFLTGYYLAYSQKDRLDIFIIYSAMTVGLLLSVLGGIIIPNQQIYIGTVLLGISVFCWTLSKKGDSLRIPGLHLFADIGAKYGLMIYVVHWSIKECFIKLDKIRVFPNQGYYLWFSPILLALATIVTCAALYNIFGTLSGIKRNKDE